MKLILTLLLIHFSFSEVRANGQDCPTSVKAIVAAALIGIGAYSAIDDLSPTNRAQRAALRAMNQANEPYMLKAGPYVSLDDLMSLSKDEYHQAIKLFEFLKEDANWRRLLGIRGIRSVDVVRYPLDEKVSFLKSSGELETRIYISFQGDPSSWRATLERFAQEAESQKVP